MHVAKAIYSRVRGTPPLRQHNLTIPIKRGVLISGAVLYTFQCNWYHAWSPDVLISGVGCPYRGVPLFTYRGAQGSFGQHAILHMNHSYKILFRERDNCVRSWSTRCVQFLYESQPRSSEKTLHSVSVCV